MVEKTELVPVEHPENPTALSLFRLSPVRVLQLQDLDQGLGRYYHEHVIVTNSFLSTGEKNWHHLQELAEVTQDLRQHKWMLQSSRTCSLAYLTMNQELAGQGLSTEDIFNFFRLCLNINTAYGNYQSAQIAKKQPVDAEYFTEAIRRSSSGGDILEKIIANNVEAVPGWFTGDLFSWYRFVKPHACFGSYLNQDVTAKYRNSIILQKREIYKKDNVGITLPDSFPDWLVKGETPDLQEVNAEYEADCQEIKTINEQITSMIKQRDCFVGLMSDKYEKIVKRLKEKVASFLTVDNPLDLVMFLGHTEKICEMAALLSVGKKPQAEDLEKAKAEGQAILKRNISQSSRNSAIFASPQILALNIEQMLLKAGGNFTPDLFYSFLYDIYCYPDRVGPFLKRLKDTDNKVYRALNYQLRPLLNFLSPDDLGSLEISLNKLKPGSNNNLNDIIWIFAEMISPGINRVDVKKYKNDQKVMETLTELANFTNRWLTDHWQWLHQEIMRSLGQPELPENVQQGEITEVSESTVATVKEIEEVSAEFQVSNLAGWRLLYSTDHSLNPKHLIDISGLTSQDITTKLTELLLKEGGHCSVKKTSIVAALEWIVTVPDIVDQTMWKEETGDGEPWGKLKRGRDRIFFKKDPAGKTMTFFIYHKTRNANMI